MKKLTPTSYALLGLLARGPSSAYELNTQLQRSVLKAFWPRAASHVYSEPKKLVAHKLATARQDTRGGRKLTVYAITRTGRKALAAWLKEPAQTHVSMPFEAMLKFLYAEAGDVDLLLSNLDALEQGTIKEARAVLAGVAPIAESGAFAAGMPYNGMALNYLVDVMEARLAWVRDSKKRLSKLKETGQSKASERIGVDAYRRLVERLESLVDVD